MDVAIYCGQTVRALREGRDGASSDREGHQMVIILSSLGQQEPSPRDFTRALNLLIESAERSRRPGMAEAARKILGDWQSKSAPGGGTGEHHGAAGR